MKKYIIGIFFPLLAVLFLAGCQEKNTKNSSANKVYWQTNKMLSSDITNWIVTTNEIFRGDLWKVTVVSESPYRKEIFLGGFSTQPLKVGSKARVVTGNFHYDNETDGQYVRFIEPLP